MTPHGTLAELFSQLTIMNTKTYLVQLTVLLLYVPVTPGLFIFTDSCGKEATVSKNLPVEPLEGTWFMVVRQPSAHIKLASKFNKTCNLKPKVVFQLRHLSDSVDILHRNTIYCKIPTHHQWLTAPQTIISVVSCSRDERTAKKEISMINNNGDSEMDPSLKGNNLDNSAPASSKITSADLSEGLTISVDNFHSSKEITAETKKQTVSSDQSLPTKRVISISTEHMPHKKSSPLVIHTISNEVPKTTPGEFYSTEATQSSAKHHSSSYIPVTVTSMVTGAVFSEEFTTKIFYIVLICFSFLVLFVIIYGCYLIYRWRERQKSAVINQRLVNKKECVVTFRHAEEAEAKMKYYTMGRKKSEKIIIEENEVPRCLR